MKKPVSALAGISQSNLMSAPCKSDMPRNSCTRVPSPVGALKRFGNRVCDRAGASFSSTKKVQKRGHAVLETDTGSARLDRRTRHKFLHMENLGFPSAASTLRRAQTTTTSTTAYAIQASSSVAQSFDDSISSLNPQPQVDEITNGGLGGDFQQPYKSSSNCGLLSKIVDPALKVITAGAQKLFSSVLDKYVYHSQQKATDDPLDSTDNYIGAETTRDSSGAMDGSHTKSRTLDTSAQDVRDLEHLSKQKISSRSEEHHLIALLHLKRSATTPDAGGERIEGTSHDFMGADIKRRELVILTSCKTKRKSYELPVYEGFRSKHDIFNGRIMSLSQKGRKNRHSILEYAVGSVGPIRRARMKSNLAHLKKLGSKPSSPSFLEQKTEADVGGASPSSVQNTCAISLLEVVEVDQGKTSMPTSGSCISSKSTEKGEIIQQESLNMVPSEENPSDRMQEEQVLESVDAICFEKDEEQVSEFVDALCFEKDQDCGEVVDYVDPVTDEVQTCLEKQDEVTNVNSNQVTSSDIKKDEEEVSSEMFPEIATTTKPLVSKSTVNGGLKRKPAFQMSFHEDYLDWEDDCPLDEVNVRDASVETSCGVQSYHVINSPLSSSTTDFSLITMENCRSLSESQTATSTEDKAPTAATDPSPSISEAPVTSVGLSVATTAKDKAPTAATNPSPSVSEGPVTSEGLFVAPTFNSSASSNVAPSSTQSSTTLAHATSLTSIVPSESAGSNSTSPLTQSLDVESCCLPPFKKLKSNHAPSESESITNTNHPQITLLPTSSSNFFLPSDNSRENFNPSSSSPFPVSVSSNSGYAMTTFYGCSWHPAFSKPFPAAANTTSGIMFSFMSSSTPASSPSISFKEPHSSIVASTTSRILSSSITTILASTPFFSSYNFDFVAPHNVTSSGINNDDMNVDDYMEVDSRASIDVDSLVSNSIGLSMDVDSLTSTSKSPADFTFGQPYTSHRQVYRGNIWRLRDRASGNIRTFDCWWRPIDDNSG